MLVRHVLMPARRSDTSLQQRYRSNDRRPRVYPRLVRSSPQGGLADRPVWPLVRHATAVCNDGACDRAERITVHCEPHRQRASLLTHAPVLLGRGTRRWSSIASTMRPRRHGELRMCATWSSCGAQRLTALTESRPLATGTCSHTYFTPTTAPRRFAPSCSPCMR